MTTYKYQDNFAAELKAKWLSGDRECVRLTVRNLKNKAQAAYIAVAVAMLLLDDGHGFAQGFKEFMHPNNWCVSALGTARNYPHTEHAATERQ